ncbi:MAG: uracil-DNA glycosylase [Bacteroidia bacterium]|jgi:uracil-DNA glycosylase|nr:uracil-DNA glycosylase [Bacteroidia bacterium]
MMDVPPTSWKPLLSDEVLKPYYLKIQQFLERQDKLGKVIYPPRKDIFNAFNLTTPQNVKVVIIGQDPYHGYGQAHGLCFSVKKGAKIPPSLRNIFKELEYDIGCEIPIHGDLSHWASQGVLLLNTILTVEEKQASSHQGIGWEEFTDKVIQTISDNKEKVVFILWGNYARKKKYLIDSKKHLIIESPHPAAEIYAGGKAGFFGSKPFSRANKYLTSPIDWCLA